MSIVESAFVWLAFYLDFSFFRFFFWEHNILTVAGWLGGWIASQGEEMTSHNHRDQLSAKAFVIKTEPAIDPTIPRFIDIEIEERNRFRELMHFEKKFLLLIFSLFGLSE